MCVSMFRLVMEDDRVFVYHNLENSRMLHSSELQCIEVEPPVSFTSQQLASNVIHEDFMYLCTC